jgi:multidrug resistance efflux pump
MAKVSKSIEQLKSDLAAVTAKKRAYEAKEKALAAKIKDAEAEAVLHLLRKENLELPELEAIVKNARQAASSSTDAEPNAADPQ